MEDKEISEELLKAIQMIPPFRQQPEVSVGTFNDPRWEHQLQLFQALQDLVSDAQRQVLIAWKSKFDPLFVDWVFGLLLLLSLRTNGAKKKVDDTKLHEAASLLLAHSDYLALATFNYSPFVKIDIRQTSIGCIYQCGSDFVRKRSIICII